MKRRGFLKRLAVLAAAAALPQRPLQEAVGKYEEIKPPPPEVLRFFAHEEIGVTICNTEAIAKLAWD